MKPSLLLTLVLSFAVLASAQTQPQHAEIKGDVIGMHDLSPGSPSSIQGTRRGSCSYCHVPHSGNGNLAPLWNQQLSKATYETYNSTTESNKAHQQMPLEATAHYA